MTEPVRRIITGDTVGPVDATAVPRYGGEATFARLPRLQDVARADVAIVGVPFDSGVSYRPGARFGPSHIRESSRLLRPYNPALQVPVFANQQVADAGDLAVNPFSIDEAIAAVERGGRALLERAPFVLTLGGDHTIALPMLRAVSAVHGPVAVVHFDAHLDTWDTYFGAAYTHGTPFRRASEEGLLDRTGCVHAGIRGPLYSDADLTEDAELGFQVVSAPEVEHIGVTGLIERIAARVGDRPVYVSIDIDVLDPAHAPGTGTPEAGGLTSRELLATLRSFARLNLVGADIVEVAPAYDHAQITGIAAAHVAYEPQQEAAMATQSREPTVEEENERGLLGQIEVHSIDWIPDTERHGKTWQQTMLWFLGNFQYFTIPIGFVGPALGLSLGWSILAGVLGIWFGTLFMAFHATQGPVFGLPQMIQTRAQLGYRGVVVALFAVLFTYMAFNVADQVLLASGLHGAFGWNPTLVAIVTAVLAAALAIFGYDWVHRVFRFLLVISFPCYAIISVAILVGHAGGTAPAHPGGFVFAAFMSQFSVAAAYNITYAPYVSDYSRYMPRDTRPRSIIAAVFFGASSSAIWLIALGAWLATRLNISDGLVGLQKSGDNVAAPLGSITAFLSAVALLATMGMNAYGGMLTVLTGVDSFKTIRTSRAWRAGTVLVLAAIWYGIGQSISTSGSDTAVSAVLNSLTLMLYLLVPWTALNLVDFFFVRRGHYAITDIFRPDGVLRRLGLARPDRVLRGLRRRDPVHGAAADRRLLLHRVLPEPRDQRRGLLLGGRAARLRPGIPGPVPLPGPGVRAGCHRCVRAGAADHRRGMR